MKHPPDEILCAYAHLLDMVFCHIRSNDFEDKEQLRDLGDALHNISWVLTNYGKWCDEEGFRESYIRPYDAKWGSKCINLEQFLNKMTHICLENESKPDL